MSERIIREQSGRVLQIVNNDPPTRNALNWDFYDGFRAAIEEASADTAIGAIVLTGAGGFFSSGGNINGLKERAQSDFETRRGSVEMLHQMIMAMRHCPKPIIAAIEGGAAGAGASLAAACDLIVSARDAYVSIAYIKIGITPDGGSTAFFGRALPRQLVSEMVFTGDRVPVERLYQCGMINRLTEPGEALQTAMTWATELADGPSTAMGVAKALVDGAQSASLQAQLDAEADAVVTALGGPEGLEGVTAFLEKRKPNFRDLS